MTQCRPFRGAYADLDHAFCHSDLVAGGLVAGGLVAGVLVAGDLVAGVLVAGVLVDDALVADGLAAGVLVGLFGLQPAGNLHEGCVLRRHCVDRDRRDCVCGADRK